MFGVILFLLIAANFAVSYQGFKSQFFFDKYKFEIEKIIVYKNYATLVTSGFLHINWQHLIFNMLSLYLFGGLVASELGIITFLVIYMASLVGGNLFSLLIHKHDSGYSSVGASGGVLGILFAVIALEPTMGIGFLFIPIHIAAWIYGLAYVLYSIYGITSQKNNVGHDAHLCGALIGMLIAIIMHPSTLLQHPVAIGLVALPAIIFIYIIYTRPHILLIDNLYFKKQQRYYNIDQKYNAEKVDQQKELDRLLDKIHKKGMHSLSAKEKTMLETYSKSLQ